MTTEKAVKQKLDPEVSQRLEGILEQAKTARLSPAQEDEAAECLKALLRAGRVGIPSAAEAMLVLPWNVGVAAISDVWPELKPMARKLLLGKLAAPKSDGARRFRLSLARKLLPQDADTASKLASAVCAEMRENGALSPKDRVTFANVFIGKGKPWLLHFPIKEWKPNEAALFITCAVETCFAGPCAPFTQLQLLRWAAESDQLAGLPDEVLAAVSKSVKRWNPRFRKQLKTEVPNLPASVAEAIAPGSLAEKKSEPADEMSPSGEAEISEEENEGSEPPDIESGASEIAEPSSASADIEISARRRESRPQQQQPREQREHRERQSPPRPPRSGGTVERGFDLGAALRQIETHVISLHKELYEAKAALRKRDEQPSRSRREPRGESPIGGAFSQPEIESLQRHNAQLEQTVTDLREQLEELASHHEDQATAMQAHGEERIENETEQFKRLLGIKLRDSFAEFESLRTQSADDVIRQHFGDMLAEVFEVLEKQGIPLCAGSAAE